MRKEIEINEITEADVRDVLLSRAEAYRKAAKTSFSAISLAAVNDSKFLSRVENRSLGFNIKTYQRMNDWLSEAEKNLSEEVK